MKYVLIFSLLLAALFSCNQPGNAPKHKTLRMNIRGEPATLDPRKGGDLLSSALHFILFEGLMRLDADGKVEPAQADSVTISEDGLTYIFHLRKTHWSNGDPVCSADFVAAWKAILSPTFPSVNAQLFYPIKNAEKVKKGELSEEFLGVYADDEQTVRVLLEYPTPYFLELVSFCVFFPVHQGIDANVPEWAYNAGPSFMTNGAFKLTRWEHQSEILISKNPYYWDAKETNLESIQISMIADEMTALQLYERGDLDYLDSALSPLPQNAIPNLLLTGDLKVRPALGLSVCFFNTEQFPLNNVHFRRALALAVNRHEIVTHVTSLKETAATRMIPPLLSNQDASFFQDGDIRRAQEELTIALQEMNLTVEDLPEISYSYSASQLHSKIAEILQEQWRKNLGIRITLKATNQKIHLANLSERNFSIAYGVWVAQYADPMNIFERFLSKENVKNYPGWENSRYQTIVRGSRNLSSQTERYKELDLAEEIFIEEMPAAPLFHSSTALLVKPYVKNILFSRPGDINYKRIKIDEN